MVLVVLYASMVCMYDAVFLFVLVLALALCGCMHICVQLLFACMFAHMQSIS
jgi:hypothetical protein